nr:PUR alpha protein [Hymenolepis microstoma]
MSVNTDESRRSYEESEKELALRTLHIENYSFYIAVKENSQGRFIKLTETAQGGQRARIFMSACAVKEFVEKLDKIILTSNSVPRYIRRSMAPINVMRSYTIIRDNRRYFLDLKENDRMRFLRVSTLTNGIRANMIIPSEGIQTLREILAEILTNYLTDCHCQLGCQERGKALRLGNKTYFFDLGSTRNDTYLSISEVKNNERNSISILGKDLVKFRDIINEIIELRSAFANLSK